jgi:hypothetical protein
MHWQSENYEFATRSTGHYPPAAALLQLSGKWPSVLER